MNNDQLYFYNRGFNDCLAKGLDTHSVKTLTDEEIEDFTVRIYNCRTGAEAHEIVLAILRKAQEK